LRERERVDAISESFDRQLLQYHASVENKLSKAEQVEYYTYVYVYTHTHT
jgi:hypothetical protein